MAKGKAREVQVKGQVISEKIAPMQRAQGKDFTQETNLKGKSVKG